MRLTFEEIKFAANNSKVAFLAKNPGYCTRKNGK
jgi:hypothetical protein